VGDEKLIIISVAVSWETQLTESMEQKYMTNSVLFIALAVTDS